MYQWEDGVACEVYRPLYPPEGGPLMGFVCMECPTEKRAVTRTKRGMVIHLAVCHGVRLQAEFKFEGKVCHAQNETSPSTDIP